MKRVLCLLLSIIMPISIMSTGYVAFAADATDSGTCGDNLKWSYFADEGKIEIAPITYGEASDMYNYDTTSAPWLPYKDNIKSVVFDDGCYGVGSKAFSGYNSLKNITFPQGFYTVGWEAFSYCTAIEKIVIPTHAEWLWSAAFQGCTGLKYASVGARNGGELPSYFFEGCTSLVAVDLGSGITKIGEYAFSNCKSLSMIKTDSTSFSAGNGSFNAVPSSLTIVGGGTASAFASGMGYSYSADGYTGSCGSSLNYSFSPISGMLTITGSGYMIDYDANVAPWKKFYGIVKSVDFSACSNASISSKAFYLCNSLKSVNLNSVTSIGWYAFNGCSSLENVSIPDSVTSVWSGCFQDCTGIQWINIGKGLTSLCSYMFAGCNNSAFWWVSLPDNIKTISDHAFTNCSSLNWNTIAAKDAVFQDGCFDGIANEATFMGAGQSTKDYVINHNSSQSTIWKFTCSTHENYTSNVVAPTCTQQGYTEYKCTLCDYSYRTDYVNSLGHNFVKTGNEGDYYFVYNCSRCGAQSVKFTSLEVSLQYLDHITKSDDNTSYSTLCDVNGDGVVSARDYAIINRGVNSADLSKRLTTVNESATHQTMEGFGASACWWSQSVGGWDNANDIIKLLYSDTEGIGLNIYRYNLGAGSENDSNLYNVNNRTQCFLKADGTYDWSKDANAQNALKVANTLCPKLRVTLFSNSAPVSMTNNGKAYCDTSDSTTYTTNLSSSNYGAFADFGVKCAEHFINEGYNVTALSPINEPQYAWRAYSATSAGQEGCYYSKTEARDCYKQFISKINASSIKDKCKITMFESGAVEGSSSTFSSYVDCMLKPWSLTDSQTWSNAETRDYFDTIEFHSYWSSKDTRLAAKSYLNGSYSNYKLKATEYCQMTNDGNSGVYDLIQAEGGSTNGMTIDYGIALADIIMQDLTILNVNEWDWWTACARGVYPDGLVYINDNDHSDIQTAKRLWCLGNFSKFTDEGSVRVDSAVSDYLNNDNIEQCAFKNTDGSLSVIYINKSTSAEYTCFDNSTYSSYKTYVTDDTHNLEEYQNGKLTSSTGIILPSRSVTTVVLK